MPKKMENEEITKNVCKCPNCGATLCLVQGEQSLEDKSLDELDEKGQRDVMEGDFKKRMGKLEEYGR